MLGLLAHKRSWRNRRQAAGQPTDRPNIVYGAETHVVWDKFANYFDVETGDEYWISGCKKRGGSARPAVSTPTGSSPACM